MNTFRQWLESIWSREPYRDPNALNRPPIQDLERKKALYKAGKYRFKVPPVSTGMWNDEDWIRYVDSSGGWTA